MGTSTTNDPKHWRARADEMRALAAITTDLDIRDALLTLADEYEKLARRAEERSDGTRTTEQQQQQQLAAGKKLGRLS